MDTSNATVKTCALCGASFTCSPADCWCSSLPPVMPLTATGDCHCPACLKAMIEAKLLQVKNDQVESA